MWFVVFNKQICCFSYRVSQCHRVWLNEKLGRMLGDGVIVESNSS